MPDSPTPSPATSASASTTGVAAPASAPVGATGVRPVVGRPGIGSISALAFVVILVPGIGAYLLLRLAGLAIGPAGLLGLLVMFMCLGLYPPLLARLGWVRRRPKRRPS